VEILKRINKVTMDSFHNVKDLLDNTLKIIGAAVGSDLCAVYQAEKNEGFQLLAEYKVQSPWAGAGMTEWVQKHADQAVQNQQVIHAVVGNTAWAYFVPLSTEAFYGILMLVFDEALGAYDMESIGTIGNALTLAVERLYLQQKLMNQYLSAIKSLVVAIEVKDVYTQGHSQRVAQYSKMIGRHMKLDENALNELEITGLVHDIGKIGIKDQLLIKEDKLTDSEFESMQRHPEIGRRILQPLNVSLNIMMGTLLHHKRYDLKGYPADIEIHELPLVPAVIGVADAFDAMTSQRSYKKPISKHEAMLELKRNRGTQFHPLIVDVMEELLLKKLI
jgi:HD-GYP domain-containing protein (c-di-GMP phosphodiesterase class II)